MTPLYLKSRAAAKALGITYSALCNLLRHDHLEPPAKDSSGDYVWLPEDIARARVALASRRKNKVTEGEPCNA